MTDEHGGAPRGRPRKAATDAAILRAATELMTEHGVEGTTLSAVARRAGVARPTVYLRWPTRAALVGAAARAAVGGAPLAMSGDLVDDIRRSAVFIARVFAVPTFAKILPELVRSVLAEPQELSFDSLAPGRRAYARQYERLASAQGFDPAINAGLVTDVLFGSAISHLLATGRPMSEADAVMLGEILIQAFSAPAEA